MVTGSFNKEKKHLLYTETKTLHSNQYITGSRLSLSVHELNLTLMEETFDKKYLKLC